MIEPEKRDGLPKGWTWAELSDFSDIILGQSPPSSTYNEEHMGLPFYQGKLEFGSIYPTPRKWCSAPKKIAEKGDVLISVRAPVGPTNICPEKSCIGRGLAAIRGKGGIEPFFILYLIRSIENTLSKAGTGTTFDAINGDQLKRLKLPLSPILEQHRIVARIEELFSHLDAGVQALQKAKAQLQRYRQSVLKAAVEGRLTEEWRKAHPEVEPASDLLAEIFKEHPSKQSGKSAGLDTFDLPDLPSGWAWTRAEQITENHDGKRVPIKEADRAQRHGLYPYYGASGIIDYMDDYLFDGDYLLIGEDGANLLSRSTPIAFQAHGRFWVNNHAHILTTLKGIPLSFLEIFFNHIVLAPYVTGTAQPKLTQKNMNNIKVPLPPLKEQQIIVELVERNINFASEMETIIDLSSKRAHRLRQSILKHAFDGSLVPQDPSDEPASMLLERLKAEKTKQPPRRGRRNNSHQMRLIQ